MSDTLPDGFRVRIRDDVRIADSGRILIGGTPLRALRLAPAAVAALREGTIEVHDEVTGLIASRLLEADLAVPVLPSGLVCSAAEMTVVIPARDRAGELDRLLGGLRPALRCIVVDDASHDPAALARVVSKHGAHLVVLTENRGPAGARNAGLAHVTTPLVAFIDSDVTAHEAVIRRLALHFADPALGLVAPLVKGQSRAVDPPWYERFDEVASSLDLGGKPSGVRPGGAVAWLPSACIIGRTRAITQIGAFDDTMRLGEDVDLVWRLVQHGWRARYDPELMVEHQARTSLRNWMGRKYDYGTGGAGLAARHGNLVAPAAFTPMYAAAALALLAQRRWSTVVVAAAVGHAAWVLNRRLPESPDRPRLALQLAGQGMAWALRQESALLLRHWWPAAAVALPFSRPMRRAVLVAAVADLAIAYAPHRNEIGLLPYAVGRRLDDLAYGAGLWAGAIRRRSLRVLRPRMVRAGTRDAASRTTRAHRVPADPPMEQSTRAR
jgi:mycofactocin system glycosyltransferase